MKTLSQSLYDLLAPGFRDYSDTRKTYIEAIDNIVYPYIQNADSVIDFGAGDGVRIKQLVGETKTDICLVENSANMVDLLRHNLPNANIIQQDFSKKSFCLSDKYDVATSLWNVIGHLDGQSDVLMGLINMKNSIKEGGFLIIDVNNRHNLKQYGRQACRNIIKDTLFYKYSNGDIRFAMNTPRESIPATVHLFTKQEIEKLFKKAGLQVYKRYFINYKTGQEERCRLFGQLLYILTIEK